MRAFISKTLMQLLKVFKVESLDKDQLCSIIQKLKLNHVTEESIFSGLIVWIQVDNSGRKNDFPAMFKELIELHEMPA